MTVPTLDQLPDHAGALPSLPEVVNYLIRALNDDGANLETLAHHINSDPAIVGRLLAAANSAASGLSTRIFSAKQAFMVLGADRVVSIILASALAYRYEVRGKAFDSYLLWQHSIGVATCARALAEQTSWRYFFTHYIEAFQLALEKADTRICHCSDKLFKSRLRGAVVRYSNLSYDASCCDVFFATNSTRSVYRIPKR